MHEEKQTLSVSERQAAFREALRGFDAFGDMSDDPRKSAAYRRNKEALGAQARGLPREVVQEAWDTIVVPKWRGACYVPSGWLNPPAGYSVEAQPASCEGRGHVG